MCPEDTFKPDGLICGNSTGTLKCASGLCTNRDEQCKAYGEGDITGECKSFSGKFSLAFGSLTTARSMQFVLPIDTQWLYQDHGLLP